MINKHKMSESIYLQFLSYDEPKEVLIKIRKFREYIYITETVIEGDRMGMIRQNSYRIEDYNYNTKK